MKISVAQFLLAVLIASGCGNSTAHSSAVANSKAASSSADAAAQARSAAGAVAPEDQAPPASKTGDFDGQSAYDFTAKLVSFGPHPPASDAIHRTQDYIASELKEFDCTVHEDNFNAPTPIGDLPMENIVAEVPGKGQGIFLLLTHYDTLRLENFVGAEDGGSSTGLMLELARVLCGSKQKEPNSVWIAFLDGEEAQVVIDGQAQWTDADSVYGSRELAARLAVSGDLKRVHAVILADMVGQKGLEISREPNSTKWLTDLVWKTADRLGYGNVFVPRETSPTSDDHGPFLKRGVASVDIIDLDGYHYWHTTQDTMDKISPKSLAIVGHVILQSVSELQQKFR